MYNSTINTHSQVEIAITTILGTLIYLGGFIGNFLSFFIFIRGEIRRVSTGLLFLLLTISNNSQLLTLTIEFMDVAYNIRLFHTVLIRCRILYWLQNIFRALSSFIACTISIDRMYRAVYPTRFQSICTCRMVRRIVIFYILIFSISMAFYLFPYMTEDADGTCSPESNSSYSMFITVIWPPIRLFLVCIVPVMIMIISNIRLWHKIRLSKQRIRPNALNLSHSTHTDSMLIFIASSNVFAFIVTQIPFHIYSIIVPYKASINHIRIKMILWSSLYFGIGFYIYSLSSKYFRSKFLQSLRWCLKKPNTVSVRRHTMPFVI